MEEKKAYYGPNESEGAIVYIPKGQEYNDVNPWMNEIWTIRYGNSVVYHKPKTWQNCWLRYGMINGKGETPLAEDLNVTHTHPNLDSLKYPLITNLKDYIENGGSLHYILNKAQDKDAFINELYKIHSHIDWSKCVFYLGEYRTFNFVGASWFTHAWDAKGLNLGRVGWSNKWEFTFRYAQEHEKTEGSNKFVGYEIPFMFAGSNILNVKLVFDRNVRLINTQGMFKALQVPLNLTMETIGEDGVRDSRVRSTKYHGVSPTVMVNMFKQTAAQITRTPNIIYWENCHSASHFCSDNWVMTTISGYYESELGEEVDGNIFTPNYPDSRGIYPNFNRENWRAFGDCFNLTHIYPLINARYLGDASFFENSNKLQEVRIKNLNTVNWNFSNHADLSQDSIVYMLTHLWDRVGKWVPYEHLLQAEKARVLNETCVQHQNRLKLYLHANHRAYLTNELLQSADRKGWDIYIGGNKVTSV